MDGTIDRQDGLLEPVDRDVSEDEHAECLVLHRESTDTIRYSKSQQWKTLVFCPSPMPPCS